MYLEIIQYLKKVKKLQKKDKNEAITMWLRTNRNVKNSQKCKGVSELKLKTLLYLNTVK